ncbi:hypothetical protein Tco_0878222 [Tanacetum coccineum]|uniref:Uncharacterized protein n=1 Tax=Tanacetum coccineum TaxID=301880 RepID=A0ABQ5C013_9ASTR
MTLCLEMGSDMEVIVISHDDTSLDAYVFSYNDSSKDSHDYLSKDSSKDLINFLPGRDPQWQFPKQTEEEEPKPLDVPMQTEKEKLKPLDVPMQIEEEDPMSLDIVYPHPEIASSSRGTNTRGQAHYGLRSLGAIHEVVVVVRKSYSLVKVTMFVLWLELQKQQIDVLVLVERETLKFLAQDKSFGCLGHNLAVLGWVIAWIFRLGNAFSIN